MSSLSWTLWVVSTGVSLVALTFAMSIYFNRRRRPKAFVLARGVGTGCLLLTVMYIIGHCVVIESPKVVTSPDSIDLPPHIELSQEFPIPEEFPPDNQTLVHPVTELYLWKNSGGPIYHVDVQIIDLVEASVGRCGKLDTFETRTFALLNPSHHARSIREDDPESPFFVSQQHDRFLTFFDNAVYGVEFDAEGDLLAPYSDKFQSYLRTQQNICGHISRRDILVKFTFIDIQGQERALLYRFGSISPFETLRQEQWFQIMSQVESPEAGLAFTLDNLEEPCRIVRFVRGDSLISACS